MKCRNLFFTLMLMTQVVSGGEILRRQQINHDGLERNYDLYIPSMYDESEAMPLWFHLHGLGGNGTETMAASRVNEVAEREGIIVAYPTAVNGDWSDSPDHNVGFMNALVEEISTNYRVDGAQVYSSGYSQGGIASYIFGAASPDTFAAIASVAGTRYSSIENVRDDVRQFMAATPNTPSRSLPLLVLHGDRDTVVPYDGGDKEVGAYGTVSYPAVEEIVGQWALSNGCNSVPTSTQLPADPDAKTSTTVLSYDSCESYVGLSGEVRSADVQLYKVADGRHRWHIDDSFDTNTEIWKFFSQHELRSNELAGDFNGDGHLSADDIDELSMAISAGVADATLDLNEDGIVDGNDRRVWVEQLAKTFFGDSNLDGIFDSGDLVQVFQRNQFEDAIVGNSGWLDGDWNGDLEFDTSDLTLAFQAGRFDSGRRVNSVVPEPSSLLLGILGLVGLVRKRP